MDRTLWARFGERTLKAPYAIQWLSDNAPYTATATVLYAHELGLVPITTPAYSPQSNGNAGRLTLEVRRRDYPAMPSAPWQFPWLRIHLLTRELLQFRLTPEVKRELKHCAEVRRALIDAGWFN